VAGTPAHPAASNHQHRCPYYNQRLFRVARAILKDDAAFRGEAELSTWLTRIVTNQALMRLRRRGRDRNVVSCDRIVAAVLQRLDAEGGSR
jgi:hypothetical protein